MDPDLLPGVQPAEIEGPVSVLLPDHIPEVILQPAHLRGKCSRGLLRSCASCARRIRSLRRSARPAGMPCIFALLRGVVVHIVIDAVRDALCHQLLHLFILHQEVLLTVGHVAHLDDRHRHPAPVDAAHGIGLPDIHGGNAGLFGIGLQDTVRQGAGFLVQVTVVWISRGLADRHGTPVAVASSVGMEPDKNIRVGLVGHSRALGIADIDIIGLTDHDDLIAPVLQLIAQEQADVECQLVFRDAGCHTGGTAADLDLGFGGTRPHRLLLRVGVALVARIDHNKAFGCFCFSPFAAGFCGILLTGGILRRGLTGPAAPGVLFLRNHIIRLCGSSACAVRGRFRAVLLSTC